MLTELVHAMGAALMLLGAILTALAVIYAICTFSVLLGLLFIAFVFLTFVILCFN